MTPTEAAWLAGFLDGEGSFMVTRSKHKGCVAPVYDAVIAATNTDRRLIDRCKALAGGKIIAVKAKNERHKDFAIWQLRGRDVATVIEAVLPHLVSKQEQARLLLSLRSLTKLGSPTGRFGTRKTPEEVAERAAIYERVKKLNQRGNPEYAAMARRRINGDAPLFAPVASEAGNPITEPNQEVAR